MNRVILLLNVVVLVVTFALALTTTDSQIGIMQSASSVAYGAPRLDRRAGGGNGDAALAYLRVVQALENVLPKSSYEELTPRQFRALHAAVEGYYRRVAEGIATAMLEDKDGAALRRAHAALGKDAREFVEDTLASSFPDAAVLRRLTTEVIKNCG